MTRLMWTFMGFPTYGGGPFEGISVQTSTPLLVGFLMVCAAEVAVGAMLWAGTAPAVSYALLPFEFIFWVGFALPFGPLLGLARTGLLLLA